MRLQRCAPRFRKPYAVKVAHTDWGDPGHPIVVCVGGVANTAMRFNYLASDLESHFRVVCMDWVGRGRSGWMADDPQEFTLGSPAFFFWRRAPLTWSFAHGQIQTQTQKAHVLHRAAAA